MHTVPLLRRLLAWAIDTVVTLAIAVFILFLTSSEAIFNLIIDQNAELVLSLVSFYELLQIGLVIQIVLTVYYVMIPVANKGQTLGKKMCKIRVVKEDGEDATFTCLFLKFAIGEQFLSALTFGVSLLVNALVILYRKDDRSMHDMIAKTKVIFVEEEEY